MSVLSAPYMHDEAAAFAHVEAMLWPEGPVCPHCGVIDRAYKLEGVRSKASKKNPEGRERHGLWKCRDCRGQFTVRKGAIFEESHIELHLWLQAIHLMVSSKKGISSHQLHRVLGITYKSAWFLSHRIRECMRDGDHGDLAAVFAQGSQGLCVQPLQCLLKRARLARSCPCKEKEAARLIEGQARADRRVSASVAGGVGQVCHAAPSPPFSRPASQVRPVLI